MKKIRPEGSRPKFYWVYPAVVNTANCLLVSDVASAFAFINKPKVNSCILQDPVVVEESPAWFWGVELVRGGYGLQSHGLQSTLDGDYHGVYQLQDGRHQNTHRRLTGKNTSRQSSRQVTVASEMIQKYPHIETERRNHSAHSCVLAPYKILRHKETDHIWRRMARGDSYITGIVPELE